MNEDPPRPVVARTAADAWVRKRIASVPYHEGIFITEAEVAQATGTSRTPVREAFLQLAAQNLIQVLPKKGAYVPPVSNAELEWVMEARMLIEGWVVQHEFRDLERLISGLDALLDEQMASIDDPLEFIRCDRQFHMSIVEAGGNPVLTSFYDGLRERQIRMGLHAINKNVRRTQEVMREHKAIVDALRTGDVKRTVQAVEFHLLSTMDQLGDCRPSRWPRIEAGPSAAPPS